MEEVQELQEIGGFGSDGLHNILILLIIVVIIGIQVKVFLEVRNKIASYKEVLPITSAFKTEKIYLTEHEIANLGLEDIYSNLDEYKSRENLSESSVFYETKSINQAEKESDKLYFSSPLGGKFLTKAMKKDAIYELHNIWDGTADFSLIISEEKIPTYIFNSALYIESGCAVVNSYSADCKNFNEVKPGVALLKKGVWEIVEKSEIEFIA